MALELNFKLPEKLYLKDPQQSSYGQRLLTQAIELIDQLGFESFTFKKLGNKMDSSEVSIYRYFENKHLLLIYLVSWYWEWVSYLIDIETMNIADPKHRLNIIIETLVYASKDNPSIDYVNESVLHRLIIAEGVKAYHTKEVDKENQEGFFLNYKELSEKVAAVIKEVNPDFPYPRALASNLFEMANNQLYFAQHLPRLTDVRIDKEDFKEVEEMLKYFAFSLLEK